MLGQSVYDNLLVMIKAVKYNFVIGQPYNSWDSKILEYGVS